MYQSLERLTLLIVVSKVASGSFDSADSWKSSSVATRAVVAFGGVRVAWARREFVGQPVGPGDLQSSSRGDRRGIGRILTMLSYTLIVAETNWREPDESRPKDACAARAQGARARSHWKDVVGGTGIEPVTSTV